MARERDNVLDRQPDEANDAEGSPAAVLMRVMRRISPHTVTAANTRWGGMRAALGLITGTIRMALHDASRTRHLFSITRSNANVSSCKTEGNPRGQMADARCENNAW